MRQYDRPSELRKTPPLSNAGVRSHERERASHSTRHLRPLASAMEPAPLNAIWVNIVSAMLTAGTMARAGLFLVRF
jgi:hypothetical protein